MSVRKSGRIIAGTPRTTGGVEIGDMGFAPLGIDESLNLRRYLNGQVISQTQFVSFTNKVKSAIALYPNLAATETNWQAEKTNSKLGQVGKFVIDDTAQTIRLPAVVNAQGLLSLSGIGNLVNESLPNITGNWAGVYNSIGLSGAVTGLFSTSADYPESIPVGGQGVYAKFTLDASRSSSTYQDNAPVQQEAIQYPYYIQVATGVEETLPAIREYKVNNSDYFGKSMYSDVAPNNASWLASNGSYNSRSVYPDYYDWLVERVNNGLNDFITTNFREYAAETTYVVWTNDAPPVVGMCVYGYAWSQGGGYVGRFTISSVSGNSITFMDTVSNIEKTCTYSKTVPSSVWDSAFVVNQNDQTFRLPLLNGEEDLPSDNPIDILGPISGTGSYDYTLTKNGWVVAKSFNSESATLVNFGYADSVETERTHAATGAAATISMFGKKGQTIRCGYLGLYYLKFIPAVGNGSLYFYVGDTVQDASLINAGAVLGQLSNKADIDASNFNADGKSLLSGLGMPSSRYIDLTLGASGATYTAPANGWFYLWRIGNGPGSFAGLYGDVKSIFSGDVNEELAIYIPVKKGDVIACYYNELKTNQVNDAFRFVYAEGEN